MRLVLVHPEIPPNTGNVARTAAATGLELHLVKPLGFSLADKHLKRAGLDYWPHVKLTVWENLECFLGGLPSTARLVAASARQGAPHHRFAFTADDWLLFGAETSGLPQSLGDAAQAHVRIPTLSTVRSLNLSTAVGVLVYSALAALGDLDALDAQGGQGFYAYSRER